MNWISRHLVYISLLLMTLLFSSCGQVIYSPIAYSGGNDYKTFVTPKGDDFSLSFEYPSNYGLGYTKYPPDSMNIRLNGVKFADFYGGFVKLIDISAYADDVDADTASKKQISDIKGNWYRNFRLIENSKIITPCGLEGREIVMTYREPIIHDVSHGKARDSEFIIYREMFFDYKNVSWRIRLYSDAASYKQTKEDFEHILKTLEVVKYESPN